MLTITQLQVRSFSLDWLDLYWVIDPVAGPASDTTPHAG